MLQPLLFGSHLKPTRRPAQATEFAEGYPRPCMFFPERRPFHVKRPQLGPDREVGLGLPWTGTG